MINQKKQTPVGAGVHCLVSLTSHKRSATKNYNSALSPGQIVQAVRDMRRAGK